MSTDADLSAADLSPEDAFALLGDRTRVAILRALANVEREAWDNDATASFSELYERVEANNTSQFAYHLDKLSGSFLTKTEEGYTLTYAGETVVRAIRSGTYHDRIEFEPVDLSGHCVACGGERLEATYETYLQVRCHECGTNLLTCPLTPQQVRNRTPEEVLASCDAAAQTRYRLALADVCEACSGQTGGTVQRIDDLGEAMYLHVSTCDGCGHAVSMPVEMRLYYHPAVAGFLWDHGVDPDQIPFWERFGHVAERWQTDIVYEDPFEAVVTIPHGDERLRATMEGEDLDVTRVERTVVRGN